MPPEESGRETEKEEERKRRRKRREAEQEKRKQKTDTSANHEAKNKQGKKRENIAPSGSKEVNSHPQIERPQPEELDIPVIGQRGADLEGEIKIDSAEPKIAPETKSELVLPKIALGEQEIAFAPVDLDTEEPSIPREKAEIEIPIVKLESPVVKPRVSSFSKNVARRRTKYEPKRIQVPLYKIIRRPKIKTLDLVDSISETVRKSVHDLGQASRAKADDENIKEGSVPRESKIKEDEKTVVEESTATSMKGRGGGLGEGFDFLETFLESRSEPGVGAAFRGGRPVCLVLGEPENDEFERVIELLCREVYRERVGGKPDPSNRTERGEMKNFEEFGSLENQINTIDLSSAKEYNPDDIDWKRFRNRLHESYSQDLGFLIINVSDRFSYEFFEDLRERIDSKGESLDMFHIGLIDLNSDLKKQVAELCWGLVTPTISGSRPEAASFNRIFQNTEKRWQKNLERLGNSEYAWVRPHRGDWSDRHYTMKAFAVKHLIENEGIPEERIYTEVPEDGAIPDIKAGERFLEIETLFGTTFPATKIYQTIKKYERGDTVEIIMPNLTYLLHYSRFKQIQKRCSDKYGIEVQFLTLDLEQEQLITLEEFEEKINNLTFYTNPT